MNLNFPPGLTAARFLAEYWQKRPLLIRNALPGYVSPLDGDELAGLALEDSIESRLVLERDGSRPWQAEQGPFDESRFQTLPSSHWTLLIQDVEKHLPEIAGLLDCFSFLPHWRLDDIMFSYAADKGSVGPHIDDYDVFLVQAAGRRRWQIEGERRSETEYIPDLDLRILPEFNPTQDWILEPGDLLYLPPHIPHWGLAEGDGCITCSVGYQAPRLDAMVLDWCDRTVQSQVPSGRYRDQPLQPQTDSAELDAGVLASMHADIISYLQQDPIAFARWFGSYVSEPKTHLQIEPEADPLEPDQFMAQWRRHGSIERNGWSKFLFYPAANDRCYLFVSGQEFSLPLRQRKTIALICRERLLDYASCIDHFSDAESQAMLCSLYNEGHLRYP
jgi:50S ribosomal protein L16 3-hydroxylase